MRDRGLAKQQEWIVLHGGNDLVHSANSNNESQETMQTLQFERDQHMQEESDLHTNLTSAPQPLVNADQIQSGKGQDVLKEDHEADTTERGSREGRGQKRGNMDSAQVDRFHKRTCRREDDFEEDILAKEEELW